MASGDKTSVVMAPTSKAGNLPIFGENGQIRDSGKEISSKADLVDGQVPYAQTPHLTGNKTLYVDAVLGDDANPGTQEQPFKTIQAAVDALPKDLGERDVFIQLAPGTYDETVTVSGFINARRTLPLKLIGAAYTSGPAETTHRVKTLILNGCACPVVVSGIAFFGVNTLKCAVLVEACIKANFNGCTFKNEESPGTISGVLSQYGSYVSLRDCAVSGFGFGVSVQYGSRAAVQGSTISNCTTGVYTSGYYGDIVQMSEVSFSGNSSDKLRQRAAVIFENGVIV